jgi:hypothetical protein
MQSLRGSLYATIVAMQVLGCTLCGALLAMHSLRGTVWQYKYGSCDGTLCDALFAMQSLRCNLARHLCNAVSLRRGLCGAVVAGTLRCSLCGALFAVHSCDALFAMRSLKSVSYRASASSRGGVCETPSWRPCQLTDSESPYST